MTESNELEEGLVRRDSTKLLDLSPQVEQHVYRMSYSDVLTPVFYFGFFGKPIVPRPYLELRKYSWH